MLPDLLPYWCTTNIDIQPIVEAIDNLKNLPEKPWWHNWPTFLGIFLAAFLAYLSNSLLARRKEKKEKTSQEDAVIKTHARDINAAIMALTNDLITLISFKKQRINPYLDDIKKINSVLDQGIKKTLDTLSASPELFKFYSPQVFNEKAYSENLNFIASYRPVYLMTLHQARGNLVLINYSIEERNNFIRRHMEASVYQAGVSIEQINVAIQMLTSYGEALELHVNSALWFFDLSIKHLMDYAVKNLPKQNIKTSEIKKEYKEFMPRDDEYFSGYLKMIEDSFANEAEKK